MSARGVLEPSGVLAHDASRRVDHLSVGQSPTALCGHRFISVDPGKGWGGETDRDLCVVCVDLATGPTA